MSNLLAQIAQGWTGNPVGSYVQGQNQARQNRLADLQLEKAQMELSAIPMKNELANMLTLAQINEARNKAPNLHGKYNPGDYTPNSFAEFVRGGMKDPGILVRYESPWKPTVQVVGNVPTVVSMQPGEGKPSVTQQPLSTPEKVTKLKANEAAAIQTAKNEADNNNTRGQIIEASQRTLDELRPVYDAINKYDLSIIYGRGESFYPEIMRSQEGIDLLAQRNQFVSLLQLAAAGKLKGQGTVTDSERKTLKDSATVLDNLNISPQLARKAFNDAMNILEKKVAPQESQQQTPTTRQRPKNIPQPVWDEMTPEQRALF